MARLIFGAVSPPPNGGGGMGNEYPMAHAIEVEGSADDVISALNAAGGGFAPLMLKQAQAESVRIYVNRAAIQFIRD